LVISQLRRYAFRRREPSAMPPQLMTDLVYNERVKLTATAINNVGIAAVVTGVIVPVAAFAYRTAPGSIDYPAWYFAGFLFLWLSGGLVCHFIARTVLLRMRP
jgi:uncharacterized membrane protein YhdT